MQKSPLWQALTRKLDRKLKNASRANGKKARIIIVINVHFLKSLKNATLAMVFGFSRPNFKN